MIHSHRFITTSMSCSTRKNVSPLSRSPSITARIFFARVGFTPASGSSRRTIFGSAIIARASSRSFFCPPERFFAYSSRSCRRPTHSSTDSALAITPSSCLRMRRGRRTRSRSRSPAMGGAATMRFSRTVRFRSSRGIWNVFTSPRRTMRWGGRPSTRCPSKTTSPASGAYSPATTLNSVDLPAPFGPIRPVIVLGLTASVQPSTARMPPKLFATSRTSRMFSAMGSPRLPRDVPLLRDDSLRQEQDEQNQEDPDHNQVDEVDPQREGVRDVRLQLLGGPGEQPEQVSAQDHAAVVPAPPKDHDDVRVERRERRELVREDDPLERGEQDAREAHERASDPERAELQDERGLPQGHRGLLVLPHRAQGAPPRGTAEVLDDE